MNINKLKNLVLVPVVLLAACAPHKALMEQPLSGDKAAPSVEKQQKAKRENVSSWEIRGAMAAKNKSKGWSAAMNWVQNGPNSYQIRLMGPLGAGTVLINKKGNTIVFQDGPKHISSTNADELLRQQTGISLPVDNLYYWVRGMPAPGKVHGEQVDAANHLVLLQQSGYHITFGDYKVVKGVALPGLIRLEGKGVMVKVIVKSWAF